MSDPGDPYRKIDIGGGINPFGETISQLESVEETITEIANIFSKTTNEMSDAIDIFKGLTAPAKEISKSKFSKSVDKLGKMFKSMLGASPATYILQSLIKMLSPLLDLLKPFLTILEIVGGLIKVMVAEALGPMFEALQPLFDALIELMPVFAEIGAALGNLLATIIRPIVDIIMMFMPLLQPILDIFLLIITLGFIPLQVILEVLKPIIEALSPLFESLSDVMGPLQPVITLVTNAITTLIKIALWPLVTAAYWIGEAIFAIIDAFTPGKVAGRKGFRRMFGEMFQTLGIPLTKAQKGALGLLGNTLPQDTSGTRMEGSNYMQLQSGGIVLSHGLYELGETEEEAVIPLSKWEKSLSTQNALLSAMLDELVAQSHYNAEIVRNKRWKLAFETRRRK